MPITQQPRRAYTEPGPGNPTEIVAGAPPLPVLIPSAPAFSQSTPKIPGYEIVRLIDQGGMSNIYLARQQGLDRQVVIKMIRPEDVLDDQIRRRFVLEASSIAALQHPNVVQIYEIGETQGMPYLCLEYMPGGNLERKIRKGLPSARESAEIVRQLADAIQAAHEQQIVHRDLKPANILWAAPESSDSAASGSDSGHTLPGARILVKITDFGLARLLYERSDQTRSGYAIGTPSFMSPEQASGHPGEIGKATDIYGLGAILYELLTGQPPFHGATSLETIRMVRFEPPVPPSQIHRSVPRDLESICLQCLEKLPENRYATAKALAADLRRYLQGRSVAAHPLGRLRKWWRRCRHSPIRLFVLACVPALALGVGIGLFVLGRARDNPNQKELERDRALDVAVAPAPIAPSSSVSAEIQQLLYQIRQHPAHTENGALLANLGGDWLRRLPQEFPNDFAVLYGVAEAYVLKNDPDQALLLFDQARQIAEEQTRQMEGGLEAWANLAAAHERRGDLRVVQKDRQAAIREYERTIAVREMLAQDDNREPRWALELASVCRKQAELYAEDKDWVTALFFYDRRLGLLKKLFTDDPALRPALRATHERIAELQRLHGAPAAAEFHKRAAEELADPKAMKD